MIARKFSDRKTTKHLSFLMIFTRLSKSCQYTLLSGCWVVLKRTKEEKRVHPKVTTRLYADHEREERIFRMIHER